MTDFFNALAAGRTGIFVLILIAFAVVSLLQWIAWLFAWGRFRPLKPGDTSSVPADTTIRKALVDLLGKIIYEFRHLLALVIVIMFALTLFLVIYAGWPDLEKIKDGVQVVVASLGGLVGSIIGYYFGESAAERRYGAPPEKPKPVQELEQQ